MESTIRTDVDNYLSATPERVIFERKPLERTILSECHFSETSFERLTNTVNAILAIINYIDTNSSATNLSDCLAIIQRQVERKQITIMAISIKIGEIRIQCNIGRQERFLLYDSYDQREDNNDANEERMVIFATDEMLHVLWRNRHCMANGTVKLPVCHSSELFGSPIYRCLLDPLREEEGLSTLVWRSRRCVSTSPFLRCRGLRMAHSGGEKTIRDVIQHNNASGLKLVKDCR